jgi:DNA-binding winged helix-turn-helix (wHTH) protein
MLKRKSIGKCLAYNGFLTTPLVELDCSDSETPQSEKSRAQTLNDSPHSCHRFRFGLFEVDLHTGELWRLGQKLKLTGQPFSVLAILLEKPGEVVSREEIQRRLWPDTFVDVNHSLNTAINKLRETLADSTDKPRFVETLSRRGYRFIAPIQIAASVTGATPRR